MPSSLYRRLLKEAGPRCGYCRTCAHLIGQPLTIEHIIAVAKGGTSAILNLWLSCRRCNQFKGVQIDAIDPESGILTPLFNPRTQRWRGHFAWSADATRIVGLSPCGRATVVALKINNDDIVSTRRLWVSVGWHPPQE